MVPLSAAPEEFASAWIPGDGPVVLTPLAAGLVNRSYRASRNGRHYALRLAATGVAELGLDRAWECRVLAAACAAGLAPRVHRCDPSSGIVVADWVPGRTLSPQEVLDSANIRSVAVLLQRVHALRIPGAPRQVSPAGWITHYRAALAAMRPGTAWGSLPSGQPDPRVLAESVLGRLSDPEAPVLCHSDLHRHNLAVTEDLVLLDWEYAHLSDPRWDLAAWMANNDAGPDFAAELLGAYRQRRASAAEISQLMLLAWVYDYVCLLWSELYLCSTPDAPPEVASRSRLLAARLLQADGQAHGRAGQLPAH